MKLLSISTDRKIFEEGSDVRARQAEYAKGYEEVHIIVFAGRGYREDSIAPNCFVYPTRSFFKILSPWSAMRLGRFIIPRRGITNVTCQDSSFTAMTGLVLKKEFSVPLEIQVHTDIGSPNFGCTLGNRIRKAMSLSYLPKADSIRVVSDRIKGFLTGTLGIDASKIEVRPIRVDIEAVKNAPIVSDLHGKHPDFRKIVLMASRLTEEKNIGLALRAWKRIIEETLRTNGDPKCLVIVGSGPLEAKLKRLAASLGISDTVVFEPWADRKTLFSYYKTADVFLNTSLYEGYGMTLVEAAAAGTRVISTDVGVAREIGATIVGYDAESVARAIMDAS